MRAQHIQNALDHLTMFIAPGADDTASVRYVTDQLNKALAECTHPATALYSWIARDDSQPNGQDLVITCTTCHTILKGGAKL